MPRAAATQAHSSRLHIIATGFSLQKVIVAAAVNHSNTVVAVLEMTGNSRLYEWPKTF